MGLTLLIVSVIMCCGLYFWIKQKKTTNYLDFLMDKKRRNKVQIITIIIIIVGLFSLSSFMAVFVVKNMGYESIISSTFDVKSQDGTIRGGGTFELTSDGPLSAQSDFTITSIRIYNFGNAWAETMEFIIEDNYGGGYYYIRFEPSDWNETTGLYIDLSSEINNFIISHTMRFNSEGIVSIKIQMLVNETTPTNCEYISYSQSSDIKVENRATWDAYQNNQLQAGGLIIGVVMVSVPITFKTFIEISDKLYEKLFEGK